MPTQKVEAASNQITWVKWIICLKTHFLCKFKLGVSEAFFFYKQETFVK